MKLFRQLLIILSIWLAGELINRLTHVPVPGSVIGMIILFACLYSGIIKPEMIKDISNFLLDHLSFFFLPAGVGLIANLDTLKTGWLPFVVICLVITIAVMLVTGHTVQLLMKRSRSK